MHFPSPHGSHSCGRVLIIIRAYAGRAARPISTGRGRRRRSAREAQEEALGPPVRSNTMDAGRALDPTKKKKRGGRGEKGTSTRFSLIFRRVLVLLFSSPRALFLSFGPPPSPPPRRVSSLVLLFSSGPRNGRPCPARTFPKTFHHNKRSARTRLAASYNLGPAPPASPSPLPSWPPSWSRLSSPPQGSRAPRAASLRKGCLRAGQARGGFGGRAGRDTGRSVPSSGRGPEGGSAGEGGERRGTRQLGALVRAVGSSRAEERGRGLADVDPTRAVEGVPSGTEDSHWGGPACPRASEATTGGPSAA